MQGSPVLMTAEPTTGRRVVSTLRMNEHKEYWTVTHPNLTDDDGPNSYKAHYRINKSTFEWLVNRLSRCSAYAGLFNQIFLKGATFRIDLTLLFSGV
jgi:hypothetical protein